MVGNGIEWCGFTRKMDQFIKKIDDGVSLLVQVQPRAGKTEYLGIHGEALKFRVTAPPVDGAANQVLCEYLAKLFSLPKSQVVILAGQTSKKKRVMLKGVKEKDVRKVLGLPE